MSTIHQWSYLSLDGRHPPQKMKMKMSHSFFLFFVNLLPRTMHCMPLSGDLQVSPGQHDKEIKKSGSYFRIPRIWALTVFYFLFFDGPNRDSGITFPCLLISFSCPFHIYFPFFLSFLHYVGQRPRSNSRCNPTNVRIKEAAAWISVSSLLLFLHSFLFVLIWPCPVARSAFLLSLHIHIVRATSHYILLQVGTYCGPYNKWIVKDKGITGQGLLFFYSFIMLGGVKVSMSYAQHLIKDIKRKVTRCVETAVVRKHSS